MGFSDLLLSEPLLKAVAEAGYRDPTPIQAAAIPAILMGKDVVGIAQTGTGKTASFVLPMIDILSVGRARARMPRSLILEPTRELAAQVAENFEKYGKYHRLSMALLIGGVGFADQDRALEKGVDVLIATPGRLIDQHERGRLLLTGIEILVIDEADRMLDMGFIPDVERICALLRPDRQTLLFSATMPPEIERLASRFLKEPKRIEVARPATANADIAQRLVGAPAAPHEKRALLRELLRAPEVQTAIVFCNRKTTVRELCQSLKRHGFRAGQIHGDMEQADRLKELERFRAGEVDVLVASDVAARGLDIKGVSHVINFDVPWHPDDYIHRIGRTGRAGARGVAITLVTPDDAEAVAAIERLTGQSIPRDPTVPPAVEAAPSGRRRRRRKGAAAAAAPAPAPPTGVASAPATAAPPPPAAAAPAPLTPGARRARRRGRGDGNPAPPPAPGFGEFGPPDFLTVPLRG
ncbi:MAG: DEAD/DEAH box helicase [Sphingomonadaceae bacterium]|uniref:DEAD/DEAH box helicase n=1 Tax=Thermaurantiacus sp. TaxID=2820283 RepID=UPI00298F3DED|nr:DEAD/DEAH box helicase [Thermaurantiacus sp.]MCS6987404.1 DEAD/DEAH box helicase [Sphingomonadaceae bacterium]MDW8415324.1 DEAD/DEAH box helicase [Thermaurantiacus sp.]